jgi:hypothetical protein
MKWIMAIAPLAFWSVPASSAGRRALLHDPVSLNIGVTCQWQSRCIKRQRAAMNHALAYVSRHRPPHWQIQQCNRNANRGGVRVDWVGFDHCIRNHSLKHRR